MPCASVTRYADGQGPGPLRCTRCCGISRPSGSRDRHASSASTSTAARCWRTSGATDQRVGRTRCPSTSGATRTSSPRRGCCAGTTTRRPASRHLRRRPGDGRATREKSSATTTSRRSTPSSATASSLRCSISTTPDPDAACGTLRWGSGAGCLSTTTLIRRSAIARRVRLFCDAYGLGPERKEVIDALLDRQKAGREFARDQVARGDPGFAKIWSWFPNDSYLLEALAYVEAHRDELSRGL